MNSVILIGRLTKDPQIKYIGEKNTMVANFRLAVDRNLKEENIKQKTDFINIEAWRTLADICNNFKKGDLVSIKGKLRIDEYLDKEGNKKYMTKIIAYEAKLLEHSKNYLNGSDVFTEENINIDEAYIPF